MIIDKLEEFLNNFYTTEGSFDKYYSANVSQTKVLSEIIKLQNECIKDVIRNSNDILAKKSATYTLGEVEKILENL